MAGMAGWLNQCTGRRDRTLGHVRIVSLLPGATEALAFLGLTDQLVGISADTAWPPEVLDRPVVNTVSIDTASMSSREIDAAANGAGGAHQQDSLYHVDPDLLRHLRPDLILTQEVCEVCAVSRRDVDLATHTLGYTPKVLSLSPATLNQVLEDVCTLAEAADVPERGQAVADSLRARVSRVRARTANLPRPRVVCLEWLDPLYSAGHWVPEMVAIAGGEDVLGQDGAPSRPIEWQQVRDAAPDVLVLMPCSLPPERVAEAFPEVSQRPGWDELLAVRAERVYAGHTHLFSQSGPRLVNGVEALARMLHPDVFTEPLPAGQALRMAPDRQQLLPWR